MSGAVVTAFASALVGGTVDVETADGLVLSRHLITSSTDAIDGKAWLVAQPAVATATGTPYRFTARTADGIPVITGTDVALPDIEDGADVLIEALTLEV